MRTELRTIAFGLMVLLSSFDLQADPLNQWTWRSPYPQGYTLAAITYGGGQFVAVGESGTIISSPDGYHWTSQSFGVFPYLRGVAYASGEYAAVGDGGGVILVSSNAATWTQVPSVTTNSLHAIAGDSSWKSDGLPQFMAGGDSGTAVICYNGLNWKITSIGTTNALRAITWDPFRDDYTVVGDACTIISAQPGYDFFQEPLSAYPTNNFYGVTISPGETNSTLGTAVVVGDLNFAYPTPYGNAIIYSSNDGANWNNQIFPANSFIYYVTNYWFPSQDFILRGVAVGPNGFVAVGDTGYVLTPIYPGVVFTSANGTNWIEQPATTSENYLQGCAYGNGLYVLVGDEGEIVVSSNLVNWTAIGGYHRSVIASMACDSNLCVASASAGVHVYSIFPDFTTLVSTNGMDWAASTTNLPTMSDLAGGGGEVVGVSGEAIYTTTDGYNWQTNSSFTNFLYGVNYVNNQFVAVGASGAIFTSLDATHWNNVSPGNAGSFSDVAYGNGLFVAAGSVCAASTDGVSWSLSTTNLPAAITKIAFGDGQFVAAASTHLLSSQNGSNWLTVYTEPSGQAISALAYNGGIFLAISDLAVFKSSDGSNWVSLGSALPTMQDGSPYYHFLGNYISPVALCACQGTFLAAGLNGIIFQSGNMWNPATINAPQVAANTFSFSYNQQMDVPYRIQTSSDLVSWATLDSGTGSGQPANFNFSSVGAGPARFFRIISP